MAIAHCQLFVGLFVCLWTVLCYKLRVG